jgi:hypothetical protein
MRSLLQFKKTLIKNFLMPHRVEKYENKTREIGRNLLLEGSVLFFQLIPNSYSNFF